MINEVFVADIEIRLRSAETSYLLSLFRKTRASGQPATVGMLSADIMKNYGRHLVLLEDNGAGDYTILYAGADIPGQSGTSIVGKTTAHLESTLNEFYRLGCLEAAGAGDAICINHIATMTSQTHRWECLFFPIAGPEGVRMYVALCMPRESKYDFSRVLFDTAPNAVLVASPIRDAYNEVSDATLLFVNRLACELAAREAPEQLVGTSLLRVFGDVTTSGNWDRILTVLRTGKAQRFDYHMRSATSSRWFSVDAAPIRDGVLITLVDISEMKRAYLELEHQKKVLMDEMEQRKGLEQELWALAHLDPLTSLPNRRAFREGAMVKLAECQTAHRPCAVIAIDIDHFKHVNDAYGHGAGDTVLRRIADIIKAPLRPNADLSARMGGEEFAVILPDADMETARAFAEKLRTRIAESVVIVGEFEIQPTVSLGIAMNRSASSLDDLLDRADRALYTAKRTGRNKVCSEADVQENRKEKQGKAA